MKNISKKNKALIIAAALLFSLPWIGVGILEWKISSKDEQALRLEDNVCLKIPASCSARINILGDISIICRDGSFATLKVKTHNQLVKKDFVIKRDLNKSKDKSLSEFDLILKKKLYKARVFYKTVDKNQIGRPFLCSN